MAHAMSLHHLSLMECSIPDLITVADDAGFRHVCVFGCAWPTDDFIFPLVSDPATFKETRSRLRDTGLTIFSINAPFIYDGIHIEHYREAFEIAASLGAKQATAVIGDPDFSRAADSFAQLTELALSVGMNPDIEFMRMSAIQSIDRAVDLARAAGNVDKSIAIDVLHFIRTGGKLSDIAGLNPRMIGNVQFSDGPLCMAEEDQVNEAMYSRMVPGEGAFPLREIAQLLPDDCVISIEAPTSPADRKGQSPADWAKTLFQSASHALVDVRPRKIENL